MSCGTFELHAASDCEYANDGNCDVPDYCPADTDVTDCGGEFYRVAFVRAAFGQLTQSGSTCGRPSFRERRLGRRSLQMRRCSHLLRRRNLFYIMDERFWILRVQPGSGHVCMDRSDSVFLFLLCMWSQLVRHRCTPPMHARPPEGRSKKRISGPDRDGARAGASASAKAGARARARF
jgi:hypothetical protein